MIMQYIRMTQSRLIFSKLLFAFDNENNQIEESLGIFQ